MSKVDFTVSQSYHIPVVKLTDKARLQNFIASIFPDLPLVGDVRCAAINDRKGAICQTRKGLIIEGQRLSAQGECYDDEGYLAIRFKYFNSVGEEIQL